MSEYLRNQIVQKMLGEPKQSPARMPPARQAADTQPSSGSGPLGAAEVDAANALGAAYYQYPGYFKKGQGGGSPDTNGKNWRRNLDGLPQAWANTRPHCAPDR